MNERARLIEQLMRYNQDRFENQIRRAAQFNKLIGKRVAKRGEARAC